MSYKKIRINDKIKIVDRKKRIDIHVEDGDSITLNNSASDFFRTLLKYKDIDKTISELADIYDISREELVSDANELIEYLERYGVVLYE